MSEWKHFEAKYYATEIHLGIWHASAQLHLISECKDDVDQEDDAVGEGDRSLGDAGFLVVAGERSSDLSGPGVVPVLEDEDSAGDEQSSTNQWEEEI